MRDYKEIASRIADDFGANATYVEDLLRQFQHNPNSVDEEWGDYFQSLLGGDESIKVESRRDGATAQAEAERPAPAPTAPTAAPQPAPAPTEPTTGERIPIRGPALKIVENRSEDHTSELQSLRHLVCRLLLEKKKKTHT